MKEGKNLELWLAVYLKDAKTMSSFHLEMIAEETTKEIRVLPQILVFSLML